jgi:hypothetical protein
MFRRSQSEDDNDSLSSVSTASTTSYQRARRVSGLAPPTNYLHRNTETSVRLHSHGPYGRRFGEHDSDYISDADSVLSFESGSKSHKSHKSNKAPAAANHLQQQPVEGATLTKLQLQRQMLQQMQPAPTNTTTNGASGALPTDTDKTTPPKTTSSAQNNASRSDAKGGNKQSTVQSRALNRNGSPPRARASNEAPSSSSPAPSASKPRSTTPTGIPRAVSGAAHSHTSSIAAASSPDERSTQQNRPGSAPVQVGPIEGETIQRMAPANSQLPRVTEGATITQSTTTEVVSTVEIQTRTGRSRVTPTEQTQHRSASVDRATGSAVKSSGPGRRSASVDRGAAPGPLSEAALRSSASAEKRSPPHQGSARKFEMREDYPERGRMRIRGANIPRTSAVEGVTPAAPAASGRSASVDVRAAPASAQRDRQPRSASVTRSDPSAGKLRSGPATPAPVTRALTESAAASYRSPPGKAVNNRAAVKTPESSGPKRGRTSFGGSGNKPTVVSNGGTVRSPVASLATKAGSSVKSAPANALNSRRLSGSGVGKDKEVTPKKPLTPKERKFTLPGAPVTPPQTSATKQPAKVNTSIVAVPSTRRLTPNRTSSSSLSTQGSGSAANSRSSTPTSLGGSSSGGRSSRKGGTPNRGRNSLTPTQLKSQNPYALRSSSSPRHSLDGSPSFSPKPASPLVRTISAPRGSFSSSNSPYANGAFSPTAGESDHESVSSPVSVVQNKLLQPPADAVPYQSSTAPLRFMMSMAHLSQESISGVYESANYNVGPRLSRGGKTTPKYVMRGADSPAAHGRSSERLPGSPREDNDQGSGHTATTHATASSNDSDDVISGSLR